MARARSVLWLVAVAWSLALLPGGASAQYLQRDNPYVYDLRIGLFPAAFQGGVSQSWFGSALRAEVDLARRFVFSVAGRLPWAEVAGETETQGYTARAGCAWHFPDEIERVPLAGSVYPEDTPALGERAGLKFAGAPVNERLGSPPFVRPEFERETHAPIRNSQSLRLGYDFVRTVERGRPSLSLEMDEPRYFANRLHILHLGYCYTTQWNLSPATAGKRELGFRRFYMDVLLTLESLTDAEPVADESGTMAHDPDFFPGGVRIGMEGAIDALLRTFRGLGFAYTLELGALPGTSGLEGYLFVGLGLELDFTLRAR
jgi:hypothetical protein